MSTGRRAELLTHPRLKFGTMIASPAGVFVAAYESEQGRLVQIVRSATSADILRLTFRTCGLY